MTNPFCGTFPRDFDGLVSFNHGFHSTSLFDFYL